MFRFAIPLAFACVICPGLTMADSPAAPLRAMLGRVPVAVLGPMTDPNIIMFGDFHAAAIALSAPPEGVLDVMLSPDGPAFRAATDVFRNSGPEQSAGMQDRVGFGLSDVVAVLGISHPPQDALVLQLDPAAADRVPAVLERNGYSWTDEQGYPALFRGADDYAIDIQARDMADPFGNGMGRASRVTIGDGVLMQAPGWPELSMLMDGSAPRLGERPEIIAILAALDGAAPGQSALVRAILLPGQAWLSPASGDIGGTDPANEVGVPFWSIGLLADLSDGRTETGVIALTYATQALAEDAAARLGQGWNTDPVDGSGQTLAALSGGAAKVRVLGQGPFVTLLLASAPTAVDNGQPTNRPFMALLNAMYQRELRIIGPIQPR